MNEGILTSSKAGYESIFQGQGGPSCSGQNRHVDSLATLASSMTEDVPRMIKVKLIAQPSIDATIGVAVVSALGPCWMDLIINFLAEN